MPEPKKYRSGKLKINTTHFEQTVQVSASETVLDVGCGSGGLAVLLAKRAKHVYALDYNQEHATKVKENAALSGQENVSTLCKDWVRALGRCAAMRYCDCIAIHFG